MTEPDDELDGLLSPKPGSEPAGLRTALFTRTERRLARRLLVRRVATIAAVMAVFGIGIVAGAVMTSRPPTPPVGKPEAAPVVVTVVVPVPVPVPQQPEPSGPVARTPDPTTASEAELRAEMADDPKEAAQLYRLAGDKYLNDRADYANAARCYRLYLVRAGDDGLTLESGDTWLLISVKNAAFKEKYDAPKTGG
jgi:hypothetical protein